MLQRWRCRQDPGFSETASLAEVISTLPRRASLVSPDTIKFLLRRPSIWKPERSATDAIELNRPTQVRISGASMPWS